MSKALAVAEANGMKLLAMAWSEEFKNRSDSESLQKCLRPMNPSFGARVAGRILVT
jgi:hypothetical protein